MELPEEADDAYEASLGNARRWSRFRRVGRQRRNQRRPPPPHHKRARPRTSRFRFAPRKRFSYMAGKKNPLGKDGKPLQCSICSSNEHLRAFCPKKKKFGGNG